MYLGGGLDLIAGNTQDALDAMKLAVPGLRNVKLFPGVGHWLQQERPAEVNTELVAFLKGL
jgi:pimeloyl-ACP methyl ester carboxylesterase